MKLQDITKEAVIVSETATLREAVETMVRRQSNSLLVTDDSGILVGEVSVADLMDAIVPEYLDGDDIAAHFATEDMFETAVLRSADMEVREFMQMDIHPVLANANLMTVAANAIAYQRARIPIVDHENRPIGIISRRGLKQLIAKFLNITDTA